MNKKYKSAPKKVKSGFVTADFFQKKCYALENKDGVWDLLCKDYSIYIKESEQDKAERQLKGIEMEIRSLDAAQNFEKIPCYNAIMRCWTYVEDDGSFTLHDIWTMPETP